MKHHVPARTLRLFGAASAVALTSGFVAARAQAAPPPAPVLAWTTASTPAAPPALAYASAAYDADNSTVVLFGGVTPSGALNDTTWVWNGQSWSAPATPEPPARELASMAFDPALHQLVLFGGQGGGGSLLSDTWAWNGAAWVQIATNGSSPPAREAAAMSYDSHGELVLFGGTGNGPDFSPTTTAPPPSGGTDQPPGPSATSATGPTRPSGAPTAGGGASAGGATAALDGTSQVTLDDTWLWTATGWIQAQASGPSARSGATLASDPAQHDAVLFGGESTPVEGGPAALLSDTWVWNGSGWTRQSSAKAPPARVAAAFDFDSSAGHPLLVGGAGDNADLSDAWLWSGSSWIEATMEGTRSARQGAASAYDAATAQMLIFGGTTGGGATLGDTGLISAVSTPVTSTTPAPATLPPAPTTTTVASGTHVVPRVTHTMPLQIRTTPTTRPKPAPKVPTTLAPARTGPSLQASQDRLRPASEVWLSGHGFSPGAVVTLSFHSVPTRLGQTTVGADGSFRVLVTVPGAASAGEHHFMADDVSTQGSVSAETAVFVFARSHNGIPLSTTLTMVGLALLIPVAAYFGMAAPGALRRRGTGSGPAT